MKLISHRGNINGPNPQKENYPDYVNDALNKGYYVEIDVWFVDGKWFLGHDKPQYEVSIEFLFKRNLYLHAKNGNAYYEMWKHWELNCFWHTNENWVLTTYDEIWTYPNEQLYPESICVLPELGYKGDLKKCSGICSDFIENYKNL